MTFRNELVAAIEPHIKDENARNVVLALLGAVRTVDAVIRGTIDDEVKANTAQLLLDFTAGLNANPFWLQPRNAGYIMPVFTNAVAGWLQSYQYAKADATPDEKLSFLVARNVLAEVACAVLYCERGTLAFAREGADLRQKIMHLRM